MRAPTKEERRGVNDYIRKISHPTGVNFYEWTIPQACRSCSNHPSNGGSGICHCTLGKPQITC